MKRILKKLKFLVFLISVAGSGGSLNAQTDSVWMEGRVTDAASRQPQTACEVQLLQEGLAKAVAFCDEEGYFSIGWTPVGTYTLSVLLGGTSLYYAEIQLMESAMVNIALMHINGEMTPPSELVSGIPPALQPGGHPLRHHHR